MLKTENDEGMGVGKADLAGAKADAFPFDRGEGDAEERRRHALKSLPQLVCKECKGVHCVDLGESSPTRIYLQNLASIQPRTSPSKFGGKIQFNIHFTP